MSGRMSKIIANFIATAAGVTVLTVVGGGCGGDKTPEKAEQGGPRIGRCFVGGPIDRMPTGPSGMVLYEADVVKHELRPICKLPGIHVMGVAEDPSTDTLVMVGIRMYPGYHRSCVIVKRDGTSEGYQEFLLEEPYGIHRDWTVTYDAEDGKFYIAFANSILENGEWIDEGLLYEYDPHNGELLELAKLEYAITLVGAGPGNKLYVVYAEPGSSSPRPHLFGYLDIRELEINPSDFEPPHGRWGTGAAAYPFNVQSEGPLYYYVSGRKGPRDYFKVAYVTDPRDRNYYREFPLESGAYAIMYSSKRDVLFYLLHTGARNQKLIGRKLSDGAEYSFELPLSGSCYSYTLIGAE
jgi:hypothetical protein